MATSTTPVEPTPDENAPDIATTTSDLDAETHAPENAATIPLASSAGEPDPAPEAARVAASVATSTPRWSGGKIAAVVGGGVLAAALLFGGGFATGLGISHLFGGGRDHGMIGEAGIDRPGPGMPYQGDHGRPGPGGHDLRGGPGPRDGGFGGRPDNGGTDNSGSPSSPQEG